MIHLVWLIPLLASLPYQIRGIIEQDTRDMFMGSGLSAVGLFIGAVLMGDRFMLLIAILQATLAVIWKGRVVPED